MKKNKKYLKAARLIGNLKADYCCLALKHFYQESETFKDLFEPSDKYKQMTGYYTAWYGNYNKNRLERTLALLLMYEMGVK